MREKHGGRVALPDLQRVDIQTAVVRKKVGENLSRFPDAGYSFVTMTLSEQAKPCDSVEFEQVGAGYHEKVAHHQVGRPGGLQLGQAVKDVECVASRFSDDPVEFPAE